MASSRMMIPLRSFALISPRQSGASMMFRAKKCNYVRCYSNHDSTALAERVSRVMAAKSEAGLTYDDLAGKLGVTNTYAAQLLLGQAKLTPETATKLKAAIPSISSDDVEHMVHTFPMRTFDNDILKEPNIYRTYEAVTHYGEAMKAIINEQCGDGIMSAIDFYCDVGTTTGKHGEKRVVITFNGKFLPFIEQKNGDNGVPSPRD
jgi:cyanate lyase